MNNQPVDALQMSSTYSRLPDQDLEVVTSTGLKRKHLNKDCPHFVPINYKVVIYDEEEPEDRSWIYKFFFGKGSPSRKKKTIWSVIGCSVIVAASLFFIIRRVSQSLEYRK